MKKNFASLDFHFTSRDSLQVCILSLALHKTSKVSVQSKENRRFRNRFLLSTNYNRRMYNHSCIRKHFYTQNRHSMQLLSLLFQRMQSNKQLY